MTDKKTDHMEKRRNRGQTYRELADEFGTSKSTAHRKLRNPNERAEEIIEEKECKKSDILSPTSCEERQRNCQ